MNSLPSPSRRRPVDLFRFLWHLPRVGRLFWRLFRDGRVGVLPKGILLGALLYVLLPFDFLSDLLPLIGIVDDLGLVLLAARAFLWLCPRPVVEEHVARLDAS